MIINILLIASRVYFQQSPTCTRVNNLVHIAMWLTPNEFWGLIMFCLWERFQSTGLQHSDPYVLCKSLCHTVDAATTLHLELFQMTAPLYVSGLLLRVIWIGVKACIDVTHYDELFIISIIEKHFLSPPVTKDNLTAVSDLVLDHFGTSFARHMARHTAWYTL